MATRVWRYISGHIFIKKYPYVKKLSPKNTFCDFQVCNIVASVWWTCPYNNMMSHFTWKRRQCNVMKKKTIPSIKYICHNKQLKIYIGLCLWIWMSKSKILIPLTFIKLKILTFLVVFFLQFLDSKLGSLMKCMST